jgi:hypothetical protein
MENTEQLNPKISHSFVSWWMLANIVGLPVLLGPYFIGYIAMAGLAMAADGGSIGSIWYLYGFLLLSLSGALIGTWLGLMQWFVLRRRIPQSGKWIWASSLGVAIGAPLSWLVYGWIFMSPIVNRPDGIYFSFWYGYITFGVLLGLSIGVSQWSVLRQQVQRAKLWIVALPVLFTSGIACANLSTVSFSFVKAVQRLIQIIVDQFPEIALTNRQVFPILDIATALLALVITSLLSGVFLRWLLQVPQQREGQNGS